MPVLPAPLPISINNPIHFREQTEAHQNTPHILLIFTIFLRENLQDNGNMSNFAHGFLKLLSHKDII